MDPQVINEFPLAAKIIVYIGTPMILGLCTAVGVLWKAKEARDIYIKEQDKANLQVLINLSKMFEIMQVDIAKLPTEVSRELSTIFSEIRMALKKR